MRTEKREKTHLKLFGIPALAPFLTRYKWIIVRMVLLACLCSLIDALYPLFNRYALDHFIAGKTLHGLPLFIALYLGVVVFQNLINFRSMYDSGRVEMSMNRDLRNAAFNHLQTLSFSYFNQNSTGYIHARVMSDTGKIGEAVSWRMMDCVWNGAYILFAVIVMFVTDRTLALWILLLLAAAGAIIACFQSRLVVLNRIVRDINAAITGALTEGIYGARSIKLLRIEDKMQDEFEARTEEMRYASVRTVRSSALLLSIVTLMSALSVAVVLMSGGRMTREGVLKIGTLSVFLSYAVGMIEPLQTIIQNISAFIAIQVNIERLTRLLNEAPDVADAPEVTEKYGDSFHPKKENWEELRGDIEFRDVTFRYPDGEENVMEHFSLKVPHGTNIAIVGETGAGKSTLVNLVCRFYEPTEGALLIDGRDARERSQLWLHSSLGYVLQTPHLFSGSVRDNLRYGRENASDEEIMEALRLVKAEEIVARMGGLDAEVGEGGSALSTGEKQLLSFARALLADPKLLILDEATSSIDTMTEKAIQEAIKVVTSGRTSFVIAHRLSTIIGADLILVVRDGKIMEQGTHKELLERKGAYYELYRRQYEEAQMEDAVRI